MDAHQTGRSTSDAMMALYLLGCFSTLALMTLTEQFGDLPAAVAAFASAWYILRL